MGILDNFKNPWAPNYNSNTALGNALGNNTNESDPYNVLNTLALQTYVLHGNDEVLGVGGNEDELKDRAIELRATFIYCFDKEVYDGLSADSRRNGIEKMSAAINNYYSTGIKTGNNENTFLRSTKFSHFMSETVDDSIKFKYYEDILPTSQDYEKFIMAFTTTDNQLRGTSNKKIKNRGLKIICIQQDRGQNSNANKDGIFAYLNYSHVENFFKTTYRADSFKYQNVTLCHEVGHLFGLEDRYQYLVNYSFDTTCYSIINNYELIPILIDPNIDKEANTETMPYNNLMFGGNEDSTFLTPYQLAIIWGNLAQTNNKDVEDNYTKIIILTPQELSISTAGRYTDAKGTAIKGIVLGLQNNLLYTYTTNNDNQLVRNFTGNDIRVSGSVAGNNVNNLLGAVSKFDNRQGIDITTANNLAQIILSNTNCNNQTILNENLRFLNSLPGI